MKLIVTDDIVNRFPELRIGIVIAQGIDGIGQSQELDEVKRGQERALRTAAQGKEILDQPNLKVWRDVYRRMGLNPKKIRPTAEALVRRVLKGSNLPSIGKAVDCYLVAELAHFLPVGGYDLDQVVGDVFLRIARRGESFIALGNTAPEEVPADEIVYADAARVLTRNWNYRDCDQTKITDKSRHIALFTEAPTAEVSTGDVEGICAKISELLVKVCGGRCRTLIASVGVGTEWALH